MDIVEWLRVRQMAPFVKGFGCRPGVSVDPGKEAGVGKPPKKEPAGQRRELGCLWGFDAAAGWPGDGFRKIADS